MVPARRQAVSLGAGQSGQLQSVEDRGQHVDDRRSGGDPPSARDARPAQDQRDAQIGPVGVLAVAPVVVLAQTLAVIAQEDGESRLRGQPLLGAREEIADPVVDVADLARVLVAPRARSVALALLLGLGGVRAFQIVGAVRLAVVDPQEDRTVGGDRLQPTHRGVGDVGGVALDRAEAVALAVEVLVVVEVEAAMRAREMALQRPVGDERAAWCSRRRGAARRAPGRRRACARRCGARREWADRARRRAKRTRARSYR